MTPVIHPFIVPIWWRCLQSISLWGFD